MVASGVIAGLAVGIAFVVMFSMITIQGGNNVDIDENTVITMERTVCFGACPAYAVAVYGNGTVVYEGFDFVAVTGRQTYQISQEDVEELVQEFYRVGFFALDDRYEMAVTDLPSTTTSITIGDTSKSVYRYGSNPEKLELLENKIDLVAGTDAWVKGESEREL